jgi:hypothetical protein
MAKVTSEDFAARLLRSAEQAAAIKAGEMEPARISRRKVTARKTTAPAGSGSFVRESAYPNPCSRG